MDREEEKDIIVRRGKTERMAEYGRGREKGWQIMGREEGRGKIGEKNEGWQSVDGEEGKDSRASGKKKRMAE
jgi:hypothetical protein